jgi:hypothetical protein
MAIPKVVDNTPVERPAEPLSEAMQIADAQEAILKMMDAEDAQPETEEEQSIEKAESQPVEDDEVLDDEAEEVEESEEESEDDDDYEATDDRDAEGEDAEVYTVKVDGEEIEVSLEELQQGYQRQSDYTKKTQGLSEERKEIEDGRNQVSQELEYLNTQRQQYQQALGQLGQQLLAGMNRFQGVDWAKMKADDPIEYVTKRDEFREEQERLKHLQTQQAQVQAQAQADFQRNHEALAVEEAKKLADLIPEFKDTESRPHLQKSIREYSYNQGYTKEEIDNLIDSRSVNVLLKAMRYDEMQKADVKSKKVKNKPKMAKAGTKRNPKTDTKRRRNAEMSNQLKSSGKVADAAKMMEEFF